MKTPTLETERLILRPIALSDAPAIQKYFDNWEIIKFTQAPWPFPADGALTHTRDHVLPAVTAGKQISWAITLKGTGEFIGRIDYRFHTHSVDRGFWMAQPFQGRGFMSEAVSVTQDYMFFDCELKEITTENAESNIASSRIAQKSGAVFVRFDPPRGHLPNSRMEVWVIKKEDWAKIRGRSG
jgi:ribosomal-protein-alanine N-acetyltransferase